MNYIAKDVYTNCNVQSHMLKIAVYGKGGIGKSTVSANLSQELSNRGFSMIQIGCDPKHDSTRLLLGGKFQETVLQKAGNRSDIKLNDVMAISESGIGCIEVGGPEPGVGCAGRGLLTAFDILTKSDIDGSEADIMIYDVLGDVVCGGFAVPMRPENSDIIYIVSSGEFMALYAANNIMRGMKNYPSEEPRLAGIIFNMRGLEKEERYMKDFSDATGVPIIAKVPRSNMFERAEDMNLPVVNAFPESDAAAAISLIADDVEKRMRREIQCIEPNPLSDIQLDNLIKGLVNPEKEPEPEGGKVTCKGRRRRRICAARGAASLLCKISDMSILIHGPESCAYTMSYTEDNHSAREYSNNTDMIVRTDNNIFCTGITDSDMISGSIGKLESQLRRLILERNGPITVVTTCVPGMIGDNSKAVIDKISKETGRDINLMDCSGLFVGDVLKGRDMAIEYLCSGIMPNISKIPGTVNFVDNGFGKMNYGKNRKNMTELLDIFSLKVNARLFDGCTSADIRTAGRAEYGIMVSESKRSLSLKASLETAGLTNYLKPVPSGFRETTEWIRDTGRRLDMNEAAEDYIASISREYDRYTAEMRPKLSGKRVLIISGTVTPVQWAIDTLKDVGMKTVKVGFIRFEDDEEAELLSSDIPVQDNYSMKNIGEDIRNLKPDLILGHSNFAKDPGVRNGFVPIESFTHKGSFNLIKRTYNLIRAPSVSEWERRRFG